MQRRSEQHIVFANSRQLFEVYEINEADNLPTIVLGNPGSYKTESARDYARKRGRDLCETAPMSTYDPTDVGGLQYLTPERLMLRSFPDMFPSAPPASGMGILLYDDYSTAPAAVQAVMFQAFLEGRIGRHLIGGKLNSGWYQIATGNLDGTGSGTTRLLAPTKSRVCTVVITPDGVVWDEDFAAPNHLSMKVRGFLKFRPELFDCFADQRENHAYPCARAWEHVSKTTLRIEAMRKAGTKVSDHAEKLAYCGRIGTAAGLEYHGYTRICDTLTSHDEIIRNPTTAPIPERLDTRCATAAMLGEKLTPKNASASIQYLSRMPVELATFALRGADKRDPAIAKNPQFIQWAVANQYALF